MYASPCTKPYIRQPPSINATDSPASIKNCSVNAMENVTTPNAAIKANIIKNDKLTQSLYLGSIIHFRHFRD